MLPWGLEPGSGEQDLFRPLRCHWYHGPDGPCGTLYRSSVWPVRAGHSAAEEDGIRVRSKIERATEARPSTVASLILAVFTVSVGLSVLLPLLPDLVERLQGVETDSAQVSLHTGLMTAAFTFSLFLFAPLCGRLSDRHGPRRILLVGLLGFGVSMLVFSFVESIVGVYAERLVSGVFAAAVMPVAAAVMGGLTSTEQGRARRLTYISMASIAGFLLGPMLGVIATHFAADAFVLVIPVGSRMVPLVSTGLLALLAACAVAVAVPNGEVYNRREKSAGRLTAKTRWLITKLLALTFIVSAGIGTFEVGLALRGKQILGLTPNQIALMFIECGMVMFVMQASVFSPWFKPDMTRWLIAPALFVLATAFFLVPRADDFKLMVVVIAAVAASAGILSPILMYWISAMAGSAQGWELGKQTAAANLGVTLGSAAGGFLFDAAGLPSASFVLAAGLTVLGFLLSFGLPRVLLVRNSSSGSFAG